MNWRQVEGRWTQVKGQARSQWARLTEDDLEFVCGRLDKLVGKVVERYGLEKEQALAEVNTWAELLDERLDAAGRSVHGAPRRGGEHLKDRRSH